MRKLSANTFLRMSPRISDLIKFLFDVSDVEILVKVEPDTLGYEYDESILSETGEGNTFRKAG